MSATVQNPVTVVEVLELLVSVETFAAIVTKVVSRLEREGASALTSIQFYHHPGSNEAGALLTFSDPERIVEHINVIGQWEEFARFIGMVRPLDVRIYGQMGSEAETWIRQFGVVSKTFERPIAGFVR